MKRLIRKIAIFSSPFLVWLLLLILVDPFNYFNLSHVVPDDVKKATSFKLNARLWKTIAFKRDPVPGIILGDSRANGINVERIKKTTGKDYFNFAHAGGTVAEIVGTFHFAKTYSRLSDVYIGINFDLYNEYNSSDEFVGAQQLVNDFKFYLFNRSVAEALVQNLIMLLAQREPQIGKPQMDKEAFWQYQLQYAAALKYERYRYPSGLYRQLQEIAAYCREHGITLAFIILPTHVDLQKRVEDFGLVDAAARFRHDLETLGTVYDFDYPNAWTTQRENFTDPFHCTADIEHRVINEVWGRAGGYARVSGHQQGTSGSDGQ